MWVSISCHKGFSFSNLLETFKFVTRKCVFNNRWRVRCYPCKCAGSVQFSHSACPTLCDPIDCSLPGFPDHQWIRSFLKLMFIKSMMPSNRLILCHPLLFPPSIFPSIRIFTNESALPIRWPKYWSFSSSISPSNDYSGLISFRMDWLDLLAVQGTLKSLLQPHSSKTLILWLSALCMVQLSHPYMTTRKTIALTSPSFFGKVMSLLFNMLSRFVIVFLPRSKVLLISWLQSPSAVILEPEKIKSFTVFILSPSICHEVTGRDAMIIYLVYTNSQISLSTFINIKVCKDHFH